MIRKSFFYKKLFSGFAGECIRVGIQKNYGRYEKWNVKSFLPGWLYPDFSRMRHRSGQCMAFPYIVGKYGGAAFVLIYLAFLLVLGLPIVVMEFAVGRASKRVRLCPLICWNPREANGT